MGCCRSAPTTSSARSWSGAPASCDWQLRRWSANSGDHEVVVDLVCGMGGQIVHERNRVAAAKRQDEVVARSSPPNGSRAGEIVRPHIDDIIIHPVGVGKVEHAVVARAGGKDEPVGLSAAGEPVVVGAAVEPVGPGVTEDSSRCRPTPAGRCRRETR